ncbi:MAG: hypothetical protein ACMUIP_16335, partial [bacterium]
MGKRFLVTLALTIAVICVMSVSSWAVPEFINYEGKLADTDGYDVNGAYEMTFYMYDIDSGGTALWSEPQTVTITDGIFNAKLGITTSFPTGLFDNDNLYLEVTIRNPDTDAYEILSPRYHLASSAFALKAKDADTVDGMHASDLGTGDGHSLDGAHAGPTDAVYVDEEGNVGIGTISPSESLEVAGTVKAAAFNLNGDTITYWPPSGGGDRHSLDAADGSPVDAVYVDNEGNIGMGVAAPSARLHLVTASPDAKGLLVKGSSIT